MHYRGHNAKYVPFTAVEWRKIQSLFRSNKVEELREACDILHMWKCRMGNSTPIFIDISQLVLNSIMLDLDSQNELCNYWNSNNLRAVHGFAIIRFVNYVNEVCQPEGAKLLSIAHAVGLLGIPGWIVNVRHDATHSQVPTLTLLQNALIFCRDWLWKNQWKHEFDEAIKELPREKFEIERADRYKLTCNEIRRVLNIFREWRKQNPTVKEPDASQRSEPPFTGIIHHVNTHPDEFIQVFVVSCLGKRLKKTQNVRDPLFAVLSEKEQLFYYPIMRILCDKDLLSSLLLELTKNIADTTVLLETRHLLSGWSDILISAFLQEGSPRFTTVSDKSWKLIIKNVILAPKFFSAEQVNRILAYMKGRLSSNVYSRITKLLSIADKLNNEEDDDDDDIMDVTNMPIKSLSDLQNPDLTLSIAEPSSNKENWTLANINEVGPLGLTKNQTAETLCLEC